MTWLHAACVSGVTGLHSVDVWVSGLSVQVVDGDAAVADGVAVAVVDGAAVEGLLAGVGVADVTRRVLKIVDGDGRSQG